MSELVMTIKADKESLDMAMKELQRAIEKYPKVANTVLENMNDYLDMSTVKTAFLERVIAFSVSSDLYRLVELVYDIKLVDVTTDDSEHREFMEVAND